MKLKQINTKFISYSSFKILALRGRQNLEHSLSWKFFQHFYLFARDYVDEEIKDLCVVDAGVHVTFLN